MDFMSAYLAGWSVLSLMCLIIGLGLMIAEMFTPGLGLMGMFGIIDRAQRAFAAGCNIHTRHNIRGAVHCGLYRIPLLHKGPVGKFKHCA